MSRTRAENYERLYSEWEFNFKEDPAKTDRWAAVSYEVFDGHVNYYYATTFPELETAFAHLADQVLEGLAPDGVYDLDTGTKIDIHVSTPIVTASEDQNLTINPLEDE